MKQEYFFKHVKVVLWGVAISFIIQILFTSQTFAAEPIAEDTAELSFEERVDQLRESIVVIGEVIAVATDVSPLEKVGLFQSLLLVAQLLEKVEEQKNQEARLIEVAAETGLDIGAITAPADVNLEHIVINLDYATFVATATLFYANGTVLTDEGGEDVLDEFGNPMAVHDRVNRIYTLAIDSRYDPTAFTAQVASAETQLLELLEIDLGIPKELLRNMTNITAYNPERAPDNALSGVNITDEELFNQFGATSQVDRVVIHFKHGRFIDGDRDDADTVIPASAAITLFTDQNEAARTIITENGQRNYQTIDTRTKSIRNHGLTPVYIIETELFVAPFADEDDREVNIHTQLPDPWYVPDPEERSVFSASRGPDSVYSNRINDAFRPEVVEYLQELFRNEDFLAGLENEMETFLDFLLENGGYERIRGGSGNPFPSGFSGECVSESDRVIVDEMVRTSIGFAVDQTDRQVLFPTPVVYYATPNSYEDDEGPVSRSCVNITEHF